MIGLDPQNPDVPRLPSDSELRLRVTTFHALALKPGDLVMLDETDTLFLPDSFERDTALFETADHDLDKHLVRNVWIHNANCVYTGYNFEKEFICNLLDREQPHVLMLKESLRVCAQSSRTLDLELNSSNSAVWPWVHFAAPRLGMDGGSLA
ncbi:hypothetical protein C8R44DRAFT_883743 [Mycena epipterygia]|nr:hypothetical protein C8R44DRAFT_883743 [Mycena epipterygia]